MNELETALRDMLEARAIAAERPVDLLGDVRQRARRLRARRQVLTAALSAAAVLVAGIVPFSLYAPNHFASSGPESAPGLPATLAPKILRPPAGWYPVFYRGAEISVPPGWLIQARPGCTGQRDVVYVAVVAREGCDRLLNAIVISPDPRAAAVSSTSEINGVPVNVTSGGGFTTYVLPSLRIEIRASGPLTRRVMSTLARSALSVMLASGPRAATPANWRWHEFAGIRFAAPANWRQLRSSALTPPDGCGNGVPDQAVEYNTARELNEPGCGASPPDVAGARPDNEGVLVAHGPATPAVPARDVSCRTSRGIRICAGPVRPYDVALDLWLSRPGAGRSVLMEIGLAGTGEAGRRILDSIELASPRGG